MTLSIIAAMSENGVIGRKNDLPWHLPADLKFFKRTTIGKPIVIGRKTFESFGKKPLPKRRNMIITRNDDYVAKGAEVYTSIDAALGDCKDEDEVFICGGSQIYAMAIPLAQRLYLTIVHAKVEGDVKFPEFDRLQWTLTSETFAAKDEKNAFDLTWQIFDKCPTRKS